MFLSLCGLDPSGLYEELAQAPDHRVVCDDKIFVGWNVDLINRGDYLYAFSHVPLHRLALRAGTFTVTCMRDPVARVLSHYNMLVAYRQQGVPHPVMAIEGKWLGDSFADFLELIPREHLERQLFTFSESYDIEEAVSRVRSLSCWFFTEEFDSGVAEINSKTGLELRPIHTRRTEHPLELDATRRGAAARSACD